MAGNTKLSWCAEQRKGGIAGFLQWVWSAVCNALGLSVWGLLQGAPSFSPVRWRFEISLWQSLGSSSLLLARSASAYFHAPSSAIAALLHTEVSEKRVYFPEVCKTIEKPVSVVWTGWNCAKGWTKCNIFESVNPFLQIDPFYNHHIFCLMS